MTGFAEARIAVAIVNYRGADLVAAGLPALLDELEGAAAHAVIVVDNASPDQGADALEAFLAGFARRAAVRLIRSPRNGGFAAGNNIAFAALDELSWTADYVMLLNPDAAVRPGAIRELVRVMAEQPRAGVVGASLENDEGVRRGAAFVFPSLMGEFARGAGIGALRRRWPSTAPVGATAQKVDWVTGAAMLIRGRMLAEIGGMDEDFFLYFEEVDFMRKATRAGWQIWHAPEARVWHAAGAATGIVAGRPKEGPMPGYWFDSWLRYFVKNHGPAYARATAAMRLAGTALGRISRALRGKSHDGPPGFFADFARRCLFGPLPAVTAEGRR